MIAGTLIGGISMGNGTANFTSTMAGATLAIVGSGGKLPYLTGMVTGKTLTVFIGSIFSTLTGIVIGLTLAAGIGGILTQVAANRL